MKIKTIGFVIVISFGMLVCGCERINNTVKEDTEFVENEENMEKDSGIKEGTYSVQVNEDFFMSPSITFDLEENHFTFSYDSLSSYLPIGSFRIEDGKVIAVTEDARYAYTFKIIDKDTISFVEKESSKIIMTDGKASVVDGTKFQFETER